jgi:hypothetical protein
MVRKKLQNAGATWNPGQGFEGALKVFSFEFYFSSKNLNIFFGVLNLSVKRNLYTTCTRSCNGHPFVRILLDLKGQV